MTAEDALECAAGEARYEASVFRREALTWLKRARAAREEERHMRRGLETLRAASDGSRNTTP